MSGRRPTAAFLDFATVGPQVETRALDALVEATYHAYSEREDVAGRIRETEIAIVNKAQIDGHAIRNAARLKLIALSATGTDNVDLAAAKDCGVAVSNIRGYCSNSVVQHVFALILGLTQRIADYDALVRAGAWQSSRSFALFDYPIRELAGRALGIVGYGALGRAVGRVGEALGMRLMVAARIGTPADAVPAGRYPFDVVLEQADALTLHCPLTPATQHLIGARELARMKDDALLINTARGGLIDSEALVAALRAGKIGGAGIDVLVTEPPLADDPLLAPDVPRLIVTPHIAWAAQEARQRAIDQVTENVRAFLAGRELRRVV
jgi:glycerate dehydrogenase